MRKGLCQCLSFRERTPLLWVGRRISVQTFERSKGLALQRSIGLTGLTFVAVSGIIGSGWLFAPMLTAQVAGPGSLISWMIGGTAMLLLTLCFAEIVALLPVAGGIARIPHFTHGDLTSMMLGWTAWVGYNTAAPIETFAMLEYLGHIYPWLFEVDSGQSQLSSTGNLVAVLVLASFVVINALGVQVFARTNAALTWVKLGVPLLVGGALVWSHLRIENFTEFGGFLPWGMDGVLAGVSSGGVIFALIGFRHAIDMAGEVRRPRVTIPIGLTLSVVICVGIYMLLQVAFIGAIPPSELKEGWGQLHFPQNLGPIAAVAAAAGIGWANVALYSGAVLAPLGGGLVSTGSNARLGYALGQNGFFPASFQILSSRGVPLRPLIFNFFFGTAILLWVPFSEAVALNGAAITLSFASGPICLMALRSQMSSTDRVFRLPLAKVAAPMAFVISTLIVYWSGWDTYLRLSLATAVGVLVFGVRLAMGQLDVKNLDWREAIWLVPYFVGAGIFSYLGRFGGGIAVLGMPWDELAVSVFALAAFSLAIWCRLPNDKAEVYRERYATEEPAETTPL